MPLAPRVGTSYEIDFKVPPDPAATRSFEGGGLRFGVEARALDATVLATAYGDDPAKLARTRAEFQDGLRVEGASVHVFDAESGEEYLRLDAFDDEPHYHYIFPGSHHTIVWWDAVAHGPFRHELPVLLRDRLGDMLAVVMEPTRLAELDLDAASDVFPDVLAELDALATR